MTLSMQDTLLASGTKYVHKQFECSKRETPFASAGHEGHFTAL